MDPHLRNAILLVVAILALVVGVIVAALWPLLTFKSEPESPPGPNDFVVQFGQAASRVAEQTGRGLVRGATDATKAKIHEALGADPDERVRQLEAEIKRREEEAAQQEEAQGDDH